MSEGRYPHAHTQDFKIYAGVLAALLVLTVITVWVSNFDFGAWNDVIAIGVASCKASLVVLFFMHGRFENRLIWAFIYYPLIILGTLLAALFIDYANRNHNDFVVGDIMVESQEHHGEDHGDKDHGDTSHGDTDNHNQDAGDHSETPADGGDHSQAPTQDAGGDHSDAPADSSEGDQSTGHEETPAETPTEGDQTPASTASNWGELSGDAVAGKTHAKGICIACHVIDDVGNALPGAPAFAVSANTERITPGFLREWFKNPQAIKPGTLMPNLALNNEQIENLIAFLATYKKA